MCSTSLPAPPRSTILPNDLRLNEKSAEPLSPASTSRMFGARRFTRSPILLALPSPVRVSVLWATFAVTPCRALSGAAAAAGVANTRTAASTARSVRRQGRVASEEKFTGHVHPCRRWGPDRSVPGLLSVVWRANTRAGRAAVQMRSVTQPRLRRLSGLVVDLGRRLRVRLVPAAALPDRREQGGCLLALARVEAVEQIVLDAVHHLRDLVDHRAPLLRDLDDVAAAILGIAAARGVATLLELIEDGDEVGGVEVQLTAERLLGDLPAVTKLDQRRDVPGTDPKRLERLGEAVGGDAAALDHQERRPLLGDAGRGALSCVLWHAWKVSMGEPLVSTNHLLPSGDASTRRQPPSAHHPRRALAGRHLVRAAAVAGRPGTAGDPGLPAHLRERGRLDPHGVPLE